MPIDDKIDKKRDSDIFKSKLLGKRPRNGNIR
jgi:hypothetical protein